MIDGWLFAVASGYAQTASAFPTRPIRFLALVPAGLYTTATLLPYTAVNAHALKNLPYNTAEFTCCVKQENLWRSVAKNIGLKPD